jgi:putative transposase
LIERGHSEISVVRQCQLLQLPRSTAYYQPASWITDRHLDLMNKIDTIYTKYPFFGSRQIKRQMKRWYDVNISRKLAGKLMKVMGLEAIYSRPKTSQPHPDHQTFPYLLRHITASYPNHIWGTDITYIPISGTFAYLVAILDWYSRYVISWVLADAMTSDFCVENLETALTVARPGYHNSDQGSQFTADNYLGALRQYPDIKISMDGRGRCMDNIFTERLWRTVKYHEVYLKDYSSFADAKQSLSHFFHDYNTDIPHSSLDGNVPADVYFEKIKLT